jgi:beta-galactosidase GanA
MVVDDLAGWGLQHGLKPHRGLSYGRELREWHRALGELQVLCDLVPPDADLDGYDLVIVPTLFVVDDDAAQRLCAVPARGGTLLVTCHSGVCGADGQVTTGVFPGVFRDVLGAWSDEFSPLQEGQRVALDDGTTVEDWTEQVYLEGAEAIVVTRRARSPPARPSPATRPATAPPGMSLRRCRQMPSTASLGS